MSWENGDPPNWGRPQKGDDPGFQHSREYRDLRSLFFLRIWGPRGCYALTVSVVSCPDTHAVRRVWVFGHETTVSVLDRYRGRWSFSTIGSPPFCCCRCFMTGSDPLLFLFFYRAACRDTRLGLLFSRQTNSRKFTILAALTSLDESWRV